MIGGSNKLISIAELAEFLGRSTSTVYKEWHSYGIPYSRHGRLVRFRERDVALWLEARERATMKAEAGKP